MRINNLECKIGKLKSKESGLLGLKYASEFILSVVEGIYDMRYAIRHMLYAVRYAIRYKLHAICDATTNSYVRNYKPFFAKRTQIPKKSNERR